MKHPLYASLSAMFNPLHSSTNQELFESTSAIKIATTKSMGDFCCEGKPSCATAKSTLFAVSKDEWDTKENAGKSMKNALYVLQAPVRPKQRRAVKKSSP